MTEILAKYRGPLGLILFATVMEMSFNTAVPLSLRFMIDDSLTPHNGRALTIIVLSLAAGAIVVSLTGLGRDRLFAKTQGCVLYDLRELMFEHLQRLSMASHSKMDTGVTLSHFSSDLGTLENALSMAIPWGVLPGLEALTSTALLLALDWRLAAIALILWPWTLMAPRSAAQRASEAAFESKTRESQLLTRLSENLGAQLLVKAFNLQSLVSSQFRELNMEVSESVRHARFVNSLMERSTTSGILLIQVGVLAASAFMALKGQITIGILVSFQGILLMLSTSLLYVMQYAPTIVQARTAWRRIAVLLSESPSVIDPATPGELKAFSRAIEFRDVDFSYDGRSLSLSNISLRVAYGQNVAFVGGSGSGKSTMLALLMRLYDPVKGVICCDDCPLTSVTQQALRDQLAVVFQESFLLNTSIQENIRMGKRDATMAEIEDAARKAEIHDVIMTMPDGYDTIVGERGSRLSGGQRQRVAIARAMIKNPRILLLDEATSALDPSTEALINETLLRLSRGRTAVSVTHRLDSVTSADRIFVFGSGRLLESGRHDELLQKGEVYARLWAKQTGFHYSPEDGRVSISPGRLKAIPILADLEPELLASTARLCVQHTFRDGDDVFRKGDAGDKFYIIVRGRFHIIRDDKVLTTLEDGDCFGEIALVTDQPRNATVRATTAATCLALDRTHFQGLIKSSPKVHERIKALVTARL